MSRSLSAVLASGMILTLTLLFAAFPVHGGTPDVKLIAADAGGLTLELTTPSPIIEQVYAEGVSYSRVRVPKWATTVLSGHPELPVAAVLIEVPPTGNITVAVTGDTPSTIPGLLVLPVPTLERSGEDLNTTRHVINESVYASSAPLPFDTAKVERVGTMRGTAVARVIFHPFQWNPSTRDLLCRQKITVKVFFENPLAPEQRPSVSSAHNAYGQLFQNTLINHTPAYGNETAGSGRPRSLAVASPTGVKIMVNHDGFYRITYNDLKKIGIVGETITANTMRLLNGEEEMAIRVVSPDSFAKGSYMDFYAEGLNTTFTDTNVYYLVWGGDSGKRMTTVDGTVTGQGEAQSSFLSTVHTEQNTQYWLEVPEADADIWFWDKFTAPDKKSYTVTIPAIGATTGTGTIRVKFRGISSVTPDPDHHTKISLNGTPVSDEHWDGTIEFIQEATIPMSLLKEGKNTVTIELPGDTEASLDSLYLNWIEVSYWRRFEAAANQLAFTVQGEGRKKMGITKVGTPKVQVLDVTDPANAGTVVNWTLTRGTLTFEDTISGRKSYLVTTQTVKPPASFAAWSPAGLKDESNGADYIIITAKEFLPSVTALVAARQKQGLRVMAVAVEDIYDEFAFGSPDPQAIKDFLTYAYASWQKPAPTYVLLMGDANWDYRNYYNTKKKNRVPAHLSFVNNNGLEHLPDDNWYVAVEGEDALPEMIIGRIPAASAAAVSDMVKKVLAYESLSTYNPAASLFAADWGEPIFETMSESYISYLPSGMTAKKVYLSTYPQKKWPQATKDITSTIKQGMLLTTYVGHGAYSQWSFAPLFETKNIASISNSGKLTFVLTFDCMNGFFGFPLSYSMGESFVVPKKTAAIAAFSPSGFGLYSDFSVLGNAVFSFLFEAGERVIGKVTTGAKIEAFSKGGSENMLRTYTLFGDPAARLKGGE